MLCLLQHIFLVRKMFISTFKCVFEAESLPWFQDLAINCVGKVFPFIQELKCGYEQYSES